MKVLTCSMLWACVCDVLAQAGFVKTLQEQGDAYGKELDAFKKAVGRKDKNQVS
jgi:hypothetical protein